MKIEVEIEDGVIPSGKEIVRIGWPKEGEHWCCFDRIIASGICATPSGVPVVIVRDAWQWPKWLKAEWICCNNCFEWRACNLEPIQDGGKGWTFKPMSGSVTADLRHLYLLFNDVWTPPPCAEWERSKLRNPNR